jgi:uncharacterized protein YcbK (DUF882 family)
MAYLWNSSLPHNATFLSRRRILKSGAALAVICLTPSLARAHKPRVLPQERTISFHNIHTGEHLRTVYWLQDNYVDEALEDINHILRDHRTEETICIDPRLLDLLCAIQQTLRIQRPFQVISAYRSPKTNARLRRQSKQVAKKSLHMYGKAIDIRIQGYSVKALTRAALSLRGGGVGYYPRSNFVHIDTGPIRSWGRIL